VAATCGDYRSIVALVAAGSGVSLIPRLATHRMDLEGVVLRPARESLTRRINALVPEGRTDPATEAMIKEVRAKAH
jgi:DNA-binding transcriptional LysR family regulator